MATSQAISFEIAHAIRMYLATLPAVRASAEQRSDGCVFKAAVFELMAIENPAIAAQALAQANAALREAHAISLDY
jgi:hypothetical protein